MRRKILLGVIGGTGLYKIPGIQILEKIKMKTPWGSPSDKITIGTFEQVKKK